MAERLNALPWKGSMGVTPSGVRIPPSPQNKTSSEVLFCGDILTFARTHFARAERMVAWNRLVRSDCVVKRHDAPRTRSRTRVCKNQKISLHFSRVSSPVTHNFLLKIWVNGKWGYVRYFLGKWGYVRYFLGKWGYVRYFLDLCVLILFTFR